MRWKEACYGGADVMERSCAVARGKDINIYNAKHNELYIHHKSFPCFITLGIKTVKNSCTA